MKILILVSALLAVGLAREGTTADEDDIKQLFDDLLADEGIALDADSYEERLAIFVLNFLLGDAGDDVDTDLMYTEEELAAMNGARLIPGLRSRLQEELEKRGIDPLAEEEEVEKRSSYLDNRRYMNEAVHQGVCGNCYLHTFIAALELAYTKSTGRRVKFSEQEMTDCYNNGCEGGDYKMVSLWMSNLDKLSTKDGYGAYRSNQLTCRTATTPDALKAIKVIDFVDVDDTNVEAAVRKYGSVMTCMAWGGAGEPCDMSNYRAGQVVSYPEVSKGCDHAVLIVGYTPTYYIVRNSHGKNWGNRGYYRIKRGTNSCGIEEDMAAIVTEVRGSKGGLTATGCPADKPYLCSKINTCSAVRSCASAISVQEEKRIVLEEKAVEEIIAEQAEEEEEEEVVAEEEVAEEEVAEEEVAEEEIEEREFADDEEIQLEKREVRIPGAEREKRDEEARIPGERRRMLAKRGVSDEDLAQYYAKRSADTDSDEVENLEKRCADKTSACGRLKAAGRLTCAGRYLTFCPKTCGACSAAPAPKVKPSGEQQGKCLRPTIANARVFNGNVMQPGEELKVRCNPGYTLVGGKATCLIQNIFTNEDKDARLIPECIRLGGNSLVGNGAGYIGEQNTYSVGPMTYSCDSWNRDVLRGVLMNERNAMPLAIGNHNYCRNPGGVEPVPFCLGTGGGGVGAVHYCFGHAGCDTCAGAADKYGADYCGVPKNLRFCLYTDKKSAERVKTIQENCAATCCAIAGC